MQQDAAKLRRGGPSSRSRNRARPSDSPPSKLARKSTSPHRAMCRRCAQRSRTLCSPSITRIRRRPACRRRRSARKQPPAFHPTASTPSSLMRKLLSTPLSTEVRFAIPKRALELRRWRSRPRKACLLHFARLMGPPRHSMRSFRAAKSSLLSADAPWLPSRRQAKRCASRKNSPSLLRHFPNLNRPFALVSPTGPLRAPQN